MVLWYSTEKMKCQFKDFEQYIFGSRSPKRLFTLYHHGCIDVRQYFVVFKLGEELRRRDAAFTWDDL